MIIESKEWAKKLNSWLNPCSTGVSSIAK